MFQTEAMAVAQHVTAVTFGVTNFINETDVQATGKNEVETISKTFLMTTAPKSQTIFNFPTMLNGLAFWYSCH